MEVKVMLFAEPAGGDWSGIERGLRLLGAIQYGALGLLVLIALRVILRPTRDKSESSRGRQTLPERRPTRE
jgi:hypothetical protein